MGHLALSFLGTFEVTLGDQPIIHFRSSKAQGLLIYLALTPEQAHTRDALATLLWPNEPETTAKHNLRQTLFRLRKIVDNSNQQPPFLLANRATIQFNKMSSYRLDVADFLRLVEEGELETASTPSWEQAVSLYHGDLLPGFTCESRLFDNWLRQERERYHQLALNMLSQLTAHRLAQTDYPAAQTLARQQLKLAPWREEAHRQLMRALALYGERSAALAQYETCRAVLAEELAVAPSVETETLIAHIREQQPDHSPAQRANPSKTRRRLTIPFVGRKAEYALLINRYHQALDDGLQVVTLSGNAGIGKTRLARQFLLWAGIQGADRLNGRAYETNTDLSYQPIIQLFRQRLERENAPEDLLSDLWLSQLTRLWPELRERYPDLPQPTQEENLARQHLFEGIARLGVALSQRAPLTLFIDDIQWVDKASLDLLQYLVGRWSEAKTPILLLLTLRQEALTEFPETQHWLTGLKRHTSVQQLPLCELSENETAQLIQGALAGDSRNETGAEQASLGRLSKWLFAETSGQPLFLTEAFKALVAEGFIVYAAETGVGWQVNWDKLQQQNEPTRIWVGVQEIVRDWLRRLSDLAEKVLMATAVLSEAATFETLCQVAGLEEMAAITALDELLNRQMLVEAAQERLSAAHEPTYSFAHQKIRDLVYAEASAARRRLLHRRAFDALKAATSSAAELAHHAQRAGLIAETIHYSLMAGNEAMDVFAAQVAIHHYQTAFQVAAQKGWPDAISGADRQVLYLGLGRAYELSDKAELAQGVYEEMVAYARQIGASAMECIGLNRLAHQYGHALLDPDKAFAVLKQARHIAEQTGDQRGLAETYGNLAMAAGMVFNTDSERSYAEHALALARELDHPQLLAHCLRRMAYVCAKLREWERGEPYAAEAQQRLEVHGNLLLANDNQRLLGGYQAQNGRTRESLQTLENALTFIQQVESKWEQADTIRFLAYVHKELGHYGQALRLARESVEMTHQANHPLVTIPLIGESQVHLAIFSLDVAQQILLDDLVANGYYPYPDEIPALLCAIHALKGEWAQAYDYARQVQTLLADGAFLPMDRHGWYQTEALLRGGAGEPARAEVARIAGVIGTNRRYRLPLLRSQAVLAQWDGDAAQAVTHLENALTLAREMGLPGEEWPILGELGKLYAGLGADGKAQQAYQEAGVIIRRLAETIDDEDLREGFLTAVPVQVILNHSE